MSELIQSGPNGLCFHLVWRRALRWGRCCLISHMCWSSSSSPELSVEREAEGWSSPRHVWSAALTNPSVLLWGRVQMCPVCTLYFMMFDLSRFTSSCSWLKRSCKYLQRQRGRNESAWVLRRLQSDLRDPITCSPCRGRPRRWCEPRGSPGCGWAPRWVGRPSPWTHYALPSRPAARLSEPSRCAPSPPSRTRAGRWNEGKVSNERCFKAWFVEGGYCWECMNCVQHSAS